MKNNLTRNSTFFGSIDQEIHLKNANAELKIKRDKKAGTISFKSSGLVVSFNGGGDVLESDPVFHESGELAAEIVKNGGIILNGGRNSGIMESTSRSAGHYGLGVNFPGQVKSGVINKYGRNLIVESIASRLHILTILAPIVVVYSGSLGTLHEIINSLVAVKNIIYENIPLPHLIVHESWKKIFEYLQAQNIISSKYLADLKYFKTPEEALKFVIPSEESR